MKMKAGDNITVDANQGLRDAVVLSVVSGSGRHGVHAQALVEYVMPRGRTFLRILSLNEHGEPWTHYSVAYGEIPHKFVEEMRGRKAEVAKVFAGGFIKPDTVRRYERASFEREQKRAAIVRQRVLALPAFYA